MSVMRAGDRAAAVVASAVGPWLEERSAHYGSSRGGAVSWYFPPRRRRERVVVFRALDGGTQRWELELQERSVPDEGREVVVHASTARRCDRDALLPVVEELITVGPSPCSAGRVDRPASSVDLGSPVLGLVLAALLLAGARAEITLAPSLIALGLPLLAVSACRVVVRTLRLAARGGPR